MYAGRAVEYGAGKEILTHPEMPYTWGLLSSVPDVRGDTAPQLIPIPGNPPSLLNPPPGCAFHPRCAAPRQGAGRPVPDRAARARARDPDGDAHSSAATCQTRRRVRTRGPAGDRAGPGGGTMSDQSRAAGHVRHPARRGRRRRAPTEPIVEVTDHVAPAVEGHAASVADLDAKPILEVRDLRMYFPVKSSGIIRRTIGHVQAVDGVSFQVPTGGALGPGGRVGLRQVDDRSADHPAATSRPAARSTSTAEDIAQAAPRASSSRCAARSR